VGSKTRGLVARFGDLLTPKQIFDRIYRINKIQLEKITTRLRCLSHSVNSVNSVQISSKAALSICGSSFCKMKFIEAPLSGAYIIETEPSYDIRGSFGRVYSGREFREKGLEADLTEISICHNLVAGTLRGMHYQRGKHAETKLVRVIRGSIFDVIVDIRPASPTYGKWFGGTLTPENGIAFYIPKGFAHGFLTLEDKTDVLYQISDTYDAQAATGFAWNDPAIAIDWPGIPTVISPKDALLPHLDQGDFSPYAE